MNRDSILSTMGQNKIDWVNWPMSAPITTCCYSRSEGLNGIIAMVFDAAASTCVAEEPVLSLMSSVKLGAATNTERISKEAVQAREKIESFRTLDPAWAGTDTELPDDWVIESAKALILDIDRRSFPMPQITASAEGEIGFSWLKDGGRVEAILTADRHLVSMAKISGQYLEGDAILFSGVLPPLTLELLNQLYHHGLHAVVGLSTRFLK